MKVLDTISHLYEVKTRRAFVLNKSKGSRILKPLIYKRPKGDFKYYWVKVVEDNGGNLVTHFNFYVNEKTFEIRYLDVVNDRELTLSQWRRDKIYGK